MGPKAKKSKEEIAAEKAAKEEEERIAAEKEKKRLEELAEKQRLEEIRVAEERAAAGRPRRQQHRRRGRGVRRR